MAIGGDVALAIGGAFGGALPFLGALAVGVAFGSGFAAAVPVGKTGFSCIRPGMHSEVPSKKCAMPWPSSLVVVCVAYS